MLTVCCDTLTNKYLHRDGCSKTSSKLHLPDTQVVWCVPKDGGYSFTSFLTLEEWQYIKIPTTRILALISSGDLNPSFRTRQYGYCPVSMSVVGPWMSRLWSMLVRWTVSFCIRDHPTWITLTVVYFLKLSVPTQMLHFSIFIGHINLLNHSS